MDDDFEYDPDYCEQCNDYHADFWDDLEYDDDWYDEDEYYCCEDDG